MLQQTPFTIGQVARRYRLETWQVRQAIKRGFLNEPLRVGPYRVFFQDDLPGVEKALHAAGYLPAPQEVGIGK